MWINTLADAYGISDDERRVLLGLARELASVQPNWWRPYADGLRSGFDHYMGLEGAARRLHTWKVTIVPGLLQTPEYRRALAWTEFPDAPTEFIERLVEVAVRRQSRLAEEGFAIDVLLAENVLRDRVGGSAVMAGQLGRLAEAGQRPNVSIQVVPYGAPAHLGSLAGSFVLMEFPKLPSTGLQEPPIVYVEGYAGDLYLEREPEVKRYRDALTEIRRVALNPDASRQLVLSLAKEYAS
ncbi:DUF5753 domain-containing protein [Nocardia tengchongensis]|uniref:DUF5753 domain-containing protein n=1 Tax=Nocardia tengchongensis TaxID=2055889 RepID=UPI0036925BA0